MVIKIQSCFLSCTSFVSFYQASQYLQLYLHQVCYQNNSKTQVQNNFNMDYNQFTYYRANPFAKQGFLPPTAFKNRHIPQFFTELPTGQQHLDKIGRKQYATNANKSTIQAQSLLKSPERYPYQNRIALDKNYERNLNTIDIEGATGGTMLSQAVRNKMKARQLIMKRDTAKASQIQPIKSKDLNQQQKRRQVAYNQFIRDQQLKKQSENRIYSDKNIFKNQTNGRNQNTRHSMEKEFSTQQVIDNPYIVENKSGNNGSIRPRYYSIEHPNQNTIGMRQSSQYAQRRGTKNDYERKAEGSQKVSERKSGSVELRKKSEDQYQKDGVLLEFGKDRKQLRQQNPTYLSSEGSIHLAARTIIKGG